jgi:hypothetical protein
MCMAPWRRGKGKDAQLANALRAHVETMWAIACTLTGDEATSLEVVKQVVREALPEPDRFCQEGLRLEVVIAAIEAGAARVFSPLEHRVRPGGYAAALGPQASALRRAFSRRLSWDVQALLWATEVEDIAEADVAHRLGQIQLGREAGCADLCLAYLDLRRDLDVSCRATLRNVFGSSAGPEKRAEDTHLGSCARCQAETRWLTDLRSALRSLAPAMPPDVWEQARRLALGDVREESSDTPRADGATQPGSAISTHPWRSPMDSRTGAVYGPPSADQPKAAVDAITNATNGCAPALVSRAAEGQMLKAEEVEAQKVSARRVVDRAVYR